MARGSIVKRCPVCRKKSGRVPGHVCSPHELIYYVVYRANGKQKWEVGGSTKKEAEKKLDIIINQLNNGSYREGRKVKFEVLANAWLEKFAKGRVKASTFRGYETDVRRHINPFFGQYWIKSVNSEVVQSFLTVLKSKKSRDTKDCEKTLDLKTINNIRVTLIGICDYAKSIRLIFENPAESVPPYKVEKKEIAFLNPTQVQLLLKNAVEPWKTVMMVAIFTGMRQGELLALQWGDIDWDRNTISVKRAVDFISKKHVPPGEKRWAFGPPKSKASLRAIILSPRLKDALMVYRKNAPVSHYDLVFCSSDGDPVTPDHLVKCEFQPTLVRARLKKVRWHDLRHTFATLLINQGENIKFLQQQMGHASIKTTIDDYGHLFPVNNEQVGGRVDQQVFGVLSNNCLTDLAETTGKTPESHDLSLESFDAGI